MRNLRPIIHPVHGLPPRNRNISVPAPAIPALSPGRKGIIPGRFTPQLLKERLTRSPAPQPGKAEAVANIILLRLHRNIPLRTGRVPKTPILLLPVPVAGVILLLQNPTAHLPQDPAVHPGLVAVVAAIVVEEAAVAEAAAAVVAHVVEEGKPKISQS